MKQEQCIAQFKETYPELQTYLQSIEEITADVFPYLDSLDTTDEDYQRVIRMLIPERIIEFRVDYERDDGSIATHRGYRVQHSSARGPYKGGLRFDASVNRDILQFLALEQTFKNALTGLPIGSGKGGSDFNPKEATESEIKRFSQAFITALYKHIGPNIDVPAGDMGVSARELGYMMGQYKRMAGEHNGGGLTGKPLPIGGSQARREATGYGVVYLAEQVLKHAKHELKGKRVVISGSGNVAIYTAEKLIEKHAVVVTLSERGGYLVCEGGITTANLDIIQQAKQERRTLKDIASEVSGVYHEGTPWQHVTADLYIPCATQNEINTDDAQAIVKHGALLVCEGANMPSTNEAVRVFQSSPVIFVPAKAANAGGVAVSTMEMSQNASHQTWTKTEVDQQLQLVMKNIFETMLEYGSDNNHVDYAKGANIGGFVRVYEAMKSLGW